MSLHLRFFPRIPALCPLGGLEQPRLQPRRHNDSNAPAARMFNTSLSALCAISSKKARVLLTRTPSSLPAWISSISHLPISPNAAYGSSKFAARRTVRASSGIDWRNCRTTFCGAIMVHLPLRRRHLLGSEPYPQRLSDLQGSILSTLA